MGFHDAYLRLTPYELAFPGDGGAAQGAGEVAAPFREMGALAFHAVPFRRAGCPVLLVEAAVCRLLTGAWEGGESAPPPTPAGYVQLPRNLFWVAATEGAPPEPVDGFFWTVSAGELLHLLLATGVREGRPGLSVVPVEQAPLAEAASWLSADMRRDGLDFATTLPGGELRELHSFMVAGEALKLAARLFSLVARRPDAVVAGEAAPEGASPAPSGLSYRRVTLGEEGA